MQNLRQLAVIVAKKYSCQFNFTVKSKISDDFTMFILKNSFPFAEKIIIFAPSQPTPCHLKRCAAEWEAFVSQFQGCSADATSDEKWQMMERMFYLYE